VPQPTHLTAIQQNARALRGNGDLAGARLMLEQGLEMAKASLGEDHPEVLSTAHLLAGLHREAGEPAAARRVLEEAIAAGQLRYGDGEPLMLAMSYTLGTVADELGNRHEARRNFGRVATAGPAVLGEDHAWVRAARTYLGDEAARGASPVSGSPATQAAPPTVPTPPVQAAPPQQSPLPSSPPTPSSPPAFQPVEFRPAPPPAYPRPLPAQPSPPTEHVPQYPSFGPGTGISATPVPTPHPVPAPPARRGRGATVAAAIAAAAAVLAATVAAVVVLTDGRDTGPTTPQGQGASSAPSAARGLPPDRVRIRDDGTVLTLTWNDPSDGTAPFIVAGARSGEQQRAMGQIPAGTTKYALNGLNAGFQYCFVVIAVYSADQLIPSERVCTARSAKPSGTGASG
jgi:Tetratricopeptide repeat